MDAVTTSARLVPATIWRVYAPRTDVYVEVTSLTAFGAKHVACVVFAELARASIAPQDITRVEVVS